MFHWGSPLAAVKSGCQRLQTNKLIKWLGWNYLCCLIFKKLAGLLAGQEKCWPVPNMMGKAKFPLKCWLVPLTLHEAGWWHGIYLCWIKISVRSCLSSHFPGLTVSHIGMTSCGLELWNCVSKQWVKWPLMKSPCLLNLSSQFWNKPSHWWGWNCVFLSLSPMISREMCVCSA